MLAPERDGMPGYLTDMVAPIHIDDMATAKRAQHAIRDILYLYRELLACGAIVGDQDTGTFDPWEFLRATSYGYSTAEDLKLLHEGSAVALICDLIDEIEQRGGDGELTRDGLANGCFDHLPVAKAALQLMTASGPQRGHSDANDFYDVLSEAPQPVFREYVLAFLTALNPPDYPVG